MWYASGSNVPTWIYAALHVYGRPKLVSEVYAVRRLLQDSAAKHEGRELDIWRLDDIAVTPLAVFWPTL